MTRDGGRHWSPGYNQYLSNLVSSRREGDLHPALPSTMLSTGSAGVSTGGAGVSAKRASEEEHLPIPGVDEALLKCSPDENADCTPWDDIGPKGGFRELNDKFRILRPPTPGSKSRSGSKRTQYLSERSGTICWSMAEAIRPDEVLEYSNLDIPEKAEGDL